MRAQSSVTRHVSPIWISDSLLSETFQRFTLTHLHSLPSRTTIRHGSSVPGPLEARRRATRRRNTTSSFASPGGASARGSPVEIAKLFGPGGRQEWWGNDRGGVGTISRESGFSPSWSWGQGPPGVPMEGLSMGEERDGFLAYREGKKLKKKEAMKIFTRRLGSCQSLSEVRERMEQLKLSCHEDLVLGPLILQHLLNSSGRFSEVRDFMLDRSLNIQHSSCLKELLHWYVVEPRTKTIRDGLFNMLSTSIELGLCSEAEVQLLLDSIPRIKIRQGGPQLGDLVEVQKWYAMIVQAARSSPVFGLQDLSQSQLRQLIALVRKAPYTPRALETFGALQLHISGHDDLKRENAFELVRLCVESKGCDSEEAMQCVGSLFGLLRPDLSVQALSRLTGYFATTKTMGQAGFLDEWGKFLGALKGPPTEDIFKQAAWRRFEGAVENDSPTPLSHDSGRLPAEAPLSTVEQESASLNLRRQAVLKLWTVTQLGASQSKTETTKPDIQSLVDYLVQIFKSRLHPHQDLMAELVFALQSLSLPSPPSILRHVIKSPISGLQVPLRGSIERYHSALTAIAANPLSCFRDDEIYQVANESSTQHMKTLAERINSDPERFLEIARGMITQDAGAGKVITRILRGNLGFKMALAYSKGSKAQPTSNLPSSSSKSPLSTPLDTDTTDTADPTDTITPSSALHIIHTLCTTFAISPVLTPREAYRKVYWLYCFLCRYSGGSGVASEITRALWHAGVVRYREKRIGVGSERLKWVLGRVRAVEGEEVAEELLRGVGREGIKGPRGGR